MIWWIGGETGDLSTYSWTAGGPDAWDDELNVRLRGTTPLGVMADDDRDLPGDDFRTSHASDIGLHTSTLNSLHEKYENKNLPAVLKVFNVTLTPCFIKPYFNNLRLNHVLSNHLRQAISMHVSIFHVPPCIITQCTDYFVNNYLRLLMCLQHCFPLCTPSVDKDSLTKIYNVVCVFRGHKSPDIIQ